jgi:hypothetical protein
LGAAGRGRGAGAAPRRTARGRGLGRAAGLAYWGRVGRAGAEELLGRGARVASACAAGAPLDRLGAELRRHHLLDLELLLGGEREQLVGRLLRLQRAFGALALATISASVGILARPSRRSAPGRSSCAGTQAIARVERARAADALVARQRWSKLVREERAELLVELVDLEVDALRLPISRSIC